MSDRETVRRSGELTEDVLLAALADEVERGRVPFTLVVGSLALEIQARRILQPHGGLLALVDGLARVEQDDTLPAGAWELRQEVATA